MVKSMYSGDSLHFENESSNVSPLFMNFALNNLKINIIYIPFANYKDVFY